MAFGPFHSARLVYRAIEDNSQDDAFLHSIRLHVESLSADTIHLLIPQGKAQTKKLSEILRNNALLGAMICKGGSASGGAASEDGGLVPVGFIAISKPHPNGIHNRNAGLAISLRGDHQNQGYGSEAIRWALGYAFVMAGMHSVSLECVGYNHRALHVYEKLGFVLEGRRRQQIWYRGTWHDTVEFSMLESEWRALKEKKSKSWAEDPTR